MTRINADIIPSTLADWHLIAEINEIPRVIDVYQNRIVGNMKFNDIPKEFTLGIGHIRFFLDKLNFIRKRYYTLIDEAYHRGYDITKSPLEDNRNKVSTWTILASNKEHRNDYKFSQDERQLIIDRIIFRLKESDKSPYYHKKKISKEEAINMILKNKELEGRGQLNLMI